MAEAVTIEDVLAQARAIRGWDSNSGGWFSPEGNCVFCFLSDTDYHAERVDNLVTVFLADDGGDLIGLQIKSIRQLLRHALLSALRERGPLDLGALLTVTFATVHPTRRRLFWKPNREANDAEVARYGELISKFGNHKVSV